MREAAYLAMLSAAGAVKRDESILGGHLPRVDMRTTAALSRTRFGNGLRRAGIRVDPYLYLLLCITTGIGLCVWSWSLGAVFAVTLGVVVTYELLFSFPQDRAARRERLTAQHLPLCAEMLGERVAAGVPLAIGLVEVLRALPKGPLKLELDYFIKQLQRGVSIECALGDLQMHLPGPEARMFCVMIKTFCISGNQIGEPLIRLATLIREHHLVTDAVSRRILMVRQTFAVIVVALCVLSLFIVNFLPPHILYSQGEVAKIVREIGALIIVGTLTVVMRLTALRAWEVDDDA